MKVIILGCGRVGAMLATQLDKAGNTVTVIDINNEAFLRLDPDFRGEKVVGNGVEHQVLKRAGIEHADAFAAVTNGDNRNIMAGQIAKEIFQVKKVVCRIYDPLRKRTYDEIGLDSICPTVIGADMLFTAISGK